VGQYPYFVIYAMNLKYDQDTIVVK